MEEDPQAVDWVVHQVEEEGLQVEEEAHQEEDASSPP